MESLLVYRVQQARSPQFLALILLLLVFLAQLDTTLVLLGHHPTLPVSHVQEGILQLLLAQVLQFVILVVQVTSPIQQEHHLHLLVNRVKWELISPLLVVLQKVHAYHVPLVLFKTQQEVSCVIHVLLGQVTTKLEEILKPLVRSALLVLFQIQQAPVRVHHVLQEATQAQTLLNRATCALPVPIPVVLERQALHHVLLAV